MQHVIIFVDEVIFKYTQLLIAEHSFVIQVQLKKRKEKKITRRVFFLFFICLFNLNFLYIFKQCIYENLQSCVGSKNKNYYF